MKAYVLVFHDVWDTAEEEPSEDVSVSGVFASLEAAEGAPPEGVELVPQRSHCDGVQPVDPSSPRGAFDDQASILEDLQVLRDGGPGDRHFGGQFPDRHGAFRQACHDRAPRAIG